jgi:hypothetical protein
MATTIMTGLSRICPFRSWRRYLQLKTGHDEIVILGDSEKTILRLSEEIAASKKK